MKVLRWFFVCCLHSETFGQIDYSSCCSNFPDSTLCGCENEVIQCHNLISTPSLRQDRRCRVVDIRESYLPITPFDFNHIQTDRLILSNNHLNNSNIDPLAFNNLKDTLKELVLSNNLLTSVPQAIKELNHLELLDLSGNPISANSFDENVMRGIGDTLTDLRFGGPELTSWPSTLNHLQALQKLTVTESVFTLMPFDAFHGFQGTLKELTIQHSQLSSIPLAVASLRYLEVLRFDDNHKVGNQGMQAPIVSGLLPYLYNVSLQADNITEFPQILGVFEKLKNVVLDRNNLKFVSDESAASVNQTSSLSLRDSGLTRIPEAFQRIAALESLDLSINNIHSIDTKDLRQLVHLKTLLLNSNPILYMSPNALSNNRMLERVELKSTNLTKVPCAVKGLMLAHLHAGSSRNITVDLQFNQIQCTCELQWLHVAITTMPSISLKIEGRCDTIEKAIQEYINDDLPACPGGAKCS
ncbi:probable serine/threonine-protein kinase DDB_G0278509 [Saccostrea echinata]|uniref:probable serine/threonine-protein kinase DDB_G0278509 n=1 Tax=Saccostrea echinata TaxID=191078 RepID=UPI002A7EF09C|nr:probable serine/threonine-protein kinase DDB_G0278509 [Saccostrea echinata]